jgi:hypothetical protein
VPVVNTTISTEVDFGTVDVAVQPRPRFELGASLSAFGATAMSVSAVAPKRPCTAAAASAVSGLGQHLGQAPAGLPKACPASGQQFAYTTRTIAVTGAGDLGPHPAREPV